MFKKFDDYLEDFPFEVTDEMEAAWHAIFEPLELDLPKEDQDMLVDERERRLQLLVQQAAREHFGEDEEAYLDFEYKWELRGTFGTHWYSCMDGEMGRRSRLRAPETEAEKKHRLATAMAHHQAIMRTLASEAPKRTIH